MGVICDQYLCIDPNCFSGVDVFFWHQLLSNTKRAPNSNRTTREEKEYLELEIKKDREALKNMSSDQAMEQYARERYYLKKKNEEVFIIEYQDSISDE